MARTLIVITAALLGLIVAMSPRIRGQQPAMLVVDGAMLIDGTGSAPVNVTVRTPWPGGGTTDAKMLSVE